MTKLSLSDLAEKMRDIDLAVLSTCAAGGGIAGRPMSNNTEVAYQGDNYFFTLESTGTVQDIRRDPRVGVSYQSKSGALHTKPFFITIEGAAELIADRSQFAEHWTKDLDRWFEDGVDTAGLVLIRVRAHRAHYWDGFEEGEISLGGHHAAASGEAGRARPPGGEARPGYQ